MAAWAGLCPIAAGCRRRCRPRPPPRLPGGAKLPAWLPHLHRGCLPCRCCGRPGQKALACHRLRALPAGCWRVALARSAHESTDVRCALQAGEAGGTRRCSLGDGREVLHTAWRCRSRLLAHQHGLCSTPMSPLPGPALSRAATPCERCPGAWRSAANRWTPCDCRLSTWGTPSTTWHGHRPPAWRAGDRLPPDRTSRPTAALQPPALVGAASVTYHSAQNAVNSDSTSP